MYDIMIYIICRKELYIYLAEALKSAPIQLDKQSVLYFET